MPQNKNRNLILLLIPFLLSLTPFVIYGQSTTIGQSAEIVQSLASKAHALSDKIASEGLMVDKLDLTASISLPIGISKKLGGIDYTIAIDSMSFDTQGGIMGAYMSLEVPGTGQKLAFGARNIRFDEKGIKPGTKLVLLEDVAVNFGANSILTFKGSSGLTGHNTLT